MLSPLHFVGNLYDDVPTCRVPCYKVHYRWLQIKFKKSYFDKELVVIVIDVIFTSVTSTTFDKTPRKRRGKISRSE